MGALRRLVPRAPAPSTRYRAGSSALPDCLVDWVSGHAVGLGGQSHQRLEPPGRTVRQMVSDRDTIKPKLSREPDLFCKF